MNSSKKLAKATGFLFLILLASGLFAEFFVRQKIFVHGDSVATANNIRNFEWLFRLGIVSDVIMTIAFFFFALLLYRLLQSVSKRHARFMVLCVLIAVSILCMNMLNQVAAMLLMS